MPKISTPWDRHRVDPSTPGRVATPMDTFAARSASEVQASPSVARRVAWEARVRPDGSVVIPASMISPVMSLLGAWWREQPSGPDASSREGLSVVKASLSPDLLQEAVHIREFGRRYGYSERTIYNFVDLGLPSIGKGRLRRVPLKEGGEWLRTHLAEVAADPMDAAVEADLRGRKGT